MARRLVLLGALGVLLSYLGGAVNQWGESLAPLGLVLSWGGFQLGKWGYPEISLDGTGTLG